jgi:hypothetical protein
MLKLGRVTGCPALPRCLHTAPEIYQYFTFAGIDKPLVGSSIKLSLYSFLVHHNPLNEINKLEPELVLYNYAQNMF